MGYSDLVPIMVVLWYDISMKTIPLTRGKEAVIDDADYELVSKYKWHYNGRYAVHTTYIDNKKVNIWMHRLIMDTPKGLFTDHINFDRLDNRKSNLRIATKSENMHNRPAQTNNTSGHKNIYFDKSRKLWAVEVKVQGKKTHIGRYKDIADALIARNEAYKDIVGEFAWQK